MEKLQPKLRFPEFKENLVRCKLSEKMNVFRGASPRPKGDPKYYGGLIPRLMIKDATRDGKYVYPKIDFLTELGAEKSRFLKKDSVVLSCSGTIVAIPTILGVDACIHDGWLGFSDFKNVSTEFLYYNFVKLHEIMQGSATTGGVFNNLTTSIIKDYEISFPLIEEQTKIANFLSAVDEKLNLLKEKKELLEDYKRSIMQKIFNQELRFKDDNGEDFGEWDNVNLQFISSNYYQGINTAADKTKYYSEGYPILQAKHITSEKISYEDSKFVNQVDYDLYKLKYKPNINEILISNIGTIGKVLLINENVDFLIAWNIFKVTLKPQITNALYITYNLKYISGLGYFDECKTGNATKFVNKSDMLNTPIYLPCLEEQTKIANFLLAIDEKIALVATQVADTQEYKKGLLQQMFI